MKTVGWPLLVSLNQRRNQEFFKQFEIKAKETEEENNDLIENNEHFDNKKQSEINETENICSLLQPKKSFIL